MFHYIFGSGFYIMQKLKYNGENNTEGNIRKTEQPMQPWWYWQSLWALCPACNDWLYYKLSTMSFPKSLADSEGSMSFWVCTTCVQQTRHWRLMPCMDMILSFWETLIAENHAMRPSTQQHSHVFSEHLFHLPICVHTFSRIALFHRELQVLFLGAFALEGGVHNWCWEHQFQGNNMIRHKCTQTHC